MAQSPSHRFGQIIGDVLEATIHGPLEAVCREYGLYLDTQHPRPARAGKKKVAWTDSKGNSHDLDYVIEQGGTEETIGAPKAFIEIAWRRYTKHSRNKVQEIQGAIIPLAETYRASHPFLGVVLAGVFTAGSLAQLRSHGFQTLYFPYENVLSAFSTAGIDATFDEETSDRELARKVAAFTALKPQQKRRISETLRNQHAAELAEFLGSLKIVLGRRIAAIVVLPLFGNSQELPDTTSAIEFLHDYDTKRAAGQFQRYEVDVRFNNGDEIRAVFQTKQSAIDFLQTME